jgi:TRAP-type C4-dicarboxylate transport system substrate-binding protein
MRRRLALLAATVTAVTLTVAPSLTQAQAPVELNLGSLAPIPSPWHTVLEKIEAHIEAGTDHRVNVVIRPPGMMGEVELVRETRKGTRLQGTSATTAALAQGGNIPLLQLIELPYLLTSFEQADAVLDKMFEPLSEVLHRRGFVLGTWSENGFRSYGTKGKPIRRPQDLHGLKMRSQESEVHMATYKTFNANAVQQSITEVRTSLQSGVVDGLDNSPVYIRATGLAKPLDYLSLTRHTYQPAAIVFSRRWMEQLSEADQQLIRDVRRFAPLARTLIRAEGDLALGQLREAGLEIVELTEEERTVFQDTARAMHDAFAARHEGGPALLDKIRQARDTE